MNIEILKKSAAETVKFFNSFALSHSKSKATHNTDAPKRNIVSKNSTDNSSSNPNNKKNLSNLHAKNVEKKSKFQKKAANTRKEATDSKSKPQKHRKLSTNDEQKTKKTQNSAVENLDNLNVKQPSVVNSKLSSPEEDITEKNICYGFIKKTESEIPRLSSINKRKNTPLRKLLWEVRKEKEEQNNLEPEQVKAKNMETSWDNAFKKLSGKKVLNDEKKILALIDKRKKQKKKGAQKWAVRDKLTMQRIEERKTKRAKNVADRLSMLKDKRNLKWLKKRVKK